MPPNDPPPVEVIDVPRPEIRPAYTLKDIVAKLNEPETQAKLDAKLRAIDAMAKRIVFEAAEELEGARDILIDVIAGSPEGESIVETFIGDFLGIER